MSDGTRPGKTGVSRFKFRSYNALQLALRRSGVVNSGSVATLLLECFLENGGRLQATKVVCRGICEEGKFSLWREEMVKLDWLLWSASQADKGIYFPGKRLNHYLNSEKIFSRDLVTRDDIIPKEDIATKKELESVKNRLSVLEKAIDKGIENYLFDNPPDNEARRIVARKNFEETGSIFVN